VQQQTDDCGFSLHNEVAPVFPILLSVPHAGREYPEALLNKLRVSPDELVRLEDRYADRLVQPAIASGITAIVAHRARAWIDLNRAEQDIDQEMVRGPAEAANNEPSAKTRGGLGLIPRRLSGCGELWNGLHDPDEVETRLKSYHRPYHAVVEHCLKQMRTRFGVAILLDIHSMPPLSRQQGWNKATIVVGDRFGKSAIARYSETILAIARGRRLEAALNHPYPGDYILRRHGDPQRNIHAIQLEVDRSLYLDELLREPSPALGTIAGYISDIAFALTDQCGWQLAVAAE
jgi:N-formylglutamate amidohydrolase